MKGKKAKVRVLRNLPVLHLVALGVCVLGVALSRPRVAEQHQKLGTSSDIYAIPGEDQLIVFSLGYRAAAADLLFGRTLVAAGIHFSEKRIFHHLDAYLKGILALDPSYYDVYRYADTLLNLSTVEMPKENLWIAREIQERGLKQFPHDAQLWMATGQFIGFLAPNRMKDKEQKKEWRAAGAKIIERACQMWDEPGNLPEVCLSNSAMLSKAGEQEAAIFALERLIAIADDDGVRGRALVQLRALTSERDARMRAQTLERMELLRREDLPMMSRIGYQLVAPPSQVESCIGQREPERVVECATSFSRRGDLARQIRAE